MEDTFRDHNMMVIPTIETLNSTTTTTTAAAATTTTTIIYIHILYIYMIMLYMYKGTEDLLRDWWYMCSHTHSRSPHLEAHGMVPHCFGNEPPTHKTSSDAQCRGHTWRTMGLRK